MRPVIAIVMMTALSAIPAIAQDVQNVEPVSTSIASLPPNQPEPLLTGRDKSVIRGFYARQFASGFCPVGLKRDGNGCVAASREKLWSVGRRLDDKVTYYPVPTELRLQLRTPPGCEFVRVQNDVLLIKPDDGTVLDAISNLQ